MSSENEVLLVDKQRTIIDKLINHLSSENINLYYEPTSNICNDVYSLIHDSKILTKTESDIVKNLNPRDIQNFLSFSNCC